MARLRGRGILLMLLGGSLSCEEELLNRLAASGAFNPSTLDFGIVGVGLTGTLPVVFENTGQASFRVDSMARPPSFILKGLAEGATFAAGSSTELEASFFALSEGEKSEALVVRTGEIEIRLDLHAVGVLQMLPQPKVEPLVLDFGLVEVGRTGRLTLAIDNTGNAAATLSGASIGSGRSDFQITLPSGIRIDPGIRGVFTVAFSPTSQGVFEDRLNIGILEIASPVEVGLKGRSDQPVGKLFCLPSAVVFEETPRGATAQQTLSCTARGGNVVLTSVTVPAEQLDFALLAQPATVDIADQASFDLSVEFRPDGLPGERVTNLAIAYLNNLGSANLDIPISGRVGPPPPDNQAISAVLTWDTVGTDIDLHLVRPGADIFRKPGDCYYDNREPDWNQTGNRSDDPFLDVDDVDGLGPETINLKNSEARRYELFVHYFDGSNDPGRTTATLDLHLLGQLVAQLQSPIKHRQTWHVGTIVWEGDHGSFEPFTGDDEDSGCTCIATRAKERATFGWLPLSVLLLARLVRRLRSRCL